MEGCALAAQSHFALPVVYDSHVLDARDELDKP
jgi:hypothetical protein